MGSASSSLTQPVGWDDITLIELALMIFGGRVKGEDVARFTRLRVAFNCGCQMCLKSAAVAYPLRED